MPVGQPANIKDRDTARHIKAGLVNKHHLNRLERLQDFKVVRVKYIGEDRSAAFLCSVSRFIQWG